MNKVHTDQDFLITCIIPAYNEEANISRVLDVVCTYGRFDDVVVVDDGSQDYTAQIAASYQSVCPALHVISLRQTMGKTGAIKRGIAAAKGSLIVMIDADLIGLTHGNIDAMIQPVVEREVDQAVLDRAGDRTPVWGWTNCAKYFGGERAFWKKDFLGIDIADNGGYLLEITNNLHYIRQGRIIRTVFCPNLYTVHQFNKLDRITGTKNYIAMAVSIVKRATLSGFVKQFFWIENSSTSALFRLYRNYPLFRLPAGVLIVLLHIVDGVSLFLLLNAFRIVKLPCRLIGRFSGRKRYSEGTDAWKQIKPD